MSGANFSKEHLDEMKANTLSTVEKDAIEFALVLSKQFYHPRTGKFKVSEKEFRKAVEDGYIKGEFSAGERILRAIELDDDINSKDLVRGEIHLFLHGLFPMLRKRLGLAMKELRIEDLIWGKFSTAQEIENRRKLALENQTAQ